jgi:hypothetical protein
MVQLDLLIQHTTFGNNTGVLSTIYGTAGSKDHSTQEPDTRTVHWA